MPALVEATKDAIESLLPELEAIYKDLHEHPELSMQEVRTARIAADYLEHVGYDVTRGIGMTGVVAVLRNGDGPT
ncbi:amidohydrolase, partial [Burkholderia sp. SIMBA_057]